jgi:hypothetical protein
MRARILHDYGPHSDQTEQDWLAAEYDNGWQPEHGQGVPIELNGRMVHRWAMIRTDLDSQPPA